MGPRGRTELFFSLLLLAGCRGGSSPITPMLATTPGAVGTATATAPAPSPAAADDTISLVRFPATLPDGTVVTKEEGYFGFVRSNPDREGRFSSIAPGQAELLYDTWLFSRDAGTGAAHVRAIRPRTFEAHGDLALGDRVTAGPMTVIWSGLVNGTDANERRVQVTILDEHGQISASGVFDELTPHDFASTDGLHHVRVRVTPHLDPDPTRGSIALEATPVDIARRGTYGVPIEPGVWEFPDGFRVRFDRSTLCSMGPQNCVCRDVYQVSSGKEPTFVPEIGPVRALGRVFSRVKDRVIVQRPRR